MPRVSCSHLHHHPATTAGVAMPRACTNPICAPCDCYDDARRRNDEAARILAMDGPEALRRSLDEIYRCA